MGKQDIIIKQYMKDNRIFADAFNYLVYHGKQVIKPEKLRPLDTVATATSKNNKAIQKTRDELKCLVAMEDDNNAYVILGIENQSEIHYAMPARNFLYDALQYNQQIQDIANKHKANKDSVSKAEFLSGFHKTDKLIPVITLVIYFGSNKWDGPTSLHEMMDLKELDEELKCMIDDYKIKLIAPAQIESEDFDKFHTNLRQVMEFIKYSKNKQKMDELRKDSAYSKIDETAVSVIEHCTHLHLNHAIKTENGEINMCDAIDEIIEDEKIEKATEIAKNMLLEKSISCETIAKCSGLPLATVQTLAEQLQIECSA